MRFPNKDEWTDEHRQAMEDAITKARDSFHERTVVSYANRNRKLAEAFRAAKAQLDITDELRVKHGNVVPPPRSEYPLWEVLLDWALDMVFEAGEQLTLWWEGRQTRRGRR